MRKYRFPDKKNARFKYREIRNGEKYSVILLTKNKKKYSVLTREFQTRHYFSRKKYEGGAGMETISNKIYSGVNGRSPDCFPRRPYGCKQTEMFLFSNWTTWLLAWLFFRTALRLKADRNDKNIKKMVRWVLARRPAFPLKGRGGDYLPVLFLLPPKVRFLFLTSRTHIILFYDVLATGCDWRFGRRRIMGYIVACS